MHLNDPQLARLIELEIKRQNRTIDLIPSESLVPKAILEVLGSPLVNKYSEGEAGRRYYPGNQYIDEIEKLAKKRAKEVFNIGDDWEVNVQCLSGTPANLAVYFGLLNPGDTIMGMSLFSGGHLSHGHKATLSGKIFKSVQYSVSEKGVLDFSQIEKLAKKHKPKIIISGYSAYPRQIDFEKFSKIAKNLGVFHMVDMAHIAGLIATGEHLSPFKYADIVTTTTHKTLNGPRGAIVFFRKELAEKINKTIFPGMQGGPHNNKIAAIALALKIAQTKEFKDVQHQIVKNTKVLSQKLIEYGFNLISGGTDTHLMLVDLSNKKVTGKEAESLLEKAGIIVNRNSVPKDNNPFDPSGIRPGTPSITFRGMKEKEAEQIALWINRIISNKEDSTKIRKEVENLCQRFSLSYDY